MRAIFFVAIDSKYYYTSSSCRLKSGAPQTFSAGPNYINNNPVYHGFTNKAEGWPYSSYNDILNNRSDIVNCTTVIEWFKKLQNFINCHKTTPKIDFGYSFE